MIHFQGVGGLVHPTRMTRVNFMFCCFCSLLNMMILLTNDERYRNFPIKPPRGLIDFKHSREGLIGEGVYI